MPITDADQLTPLEDLFNQVLTEAETYADSLVSNRPHARRLQTASQSLTSGSLTKISNFTTELDPSVDISYGTGDWTVGTSGVYVVSGQISFAANASGYRRALIYRAGALIGEAVNSAISGLDLCVQVTLPPIRLTAGDVISLRGIQNSGGALSTVAADTFFGVSWLHS